MSYFLKYQKLKFMGKVLATILFVLAFQAEVFSQSITWKDLEDVSFEEQYVDSYQDWFLVPTFGETVKNLEKTTLSIKGYLVPIDLDGKIYALSAYPYSSCFFCGAAGPESVMTLLFDGDPSRKYKIDDVATFEGELHLNKHNPEEFIYVLKHVKEID
jgi:hypothetical protein